MELKISDIKPDPNQPRKYFESEVVSGIAQGIKTIGVRPIEIDKDNVIIVGEIRWRAAKKAGLKTISCIVNTDENMSDPAKRLYRQLVSNLHPETLTEWEIACAFDKLRILDFEIRQCTDRNSAIKILSEKVGKSKDYISEKLALIESNELTLNKIREQRLKRKLKQTEGNEE